MPLTAGDLSRTLPLRRGGGQGNLGEGYLKGDSCARMGSLCDKELQRAGVGLGPFTDLGFIFFA